MVAACVLHAAIMQYAHCVLCMRVSMCGVHVGVYHTMTYMHVCMHIMYIANKFCSIML